MTPLARLLQEMIATDGPMSLSHYMQLCLLHPTMGYYVTHDPLGADGDFTTAPEISQMFGELLGLCLAQGWQDQGADGPVNLVELGPGRGTLMRDVLRIAGPHLPQHHVHLIEASPSLREVQRQTLGAGPVTWHDQLDQLPEGPLLLIANEFFDALPIRQFRRGTTGWHERRVTFENDRFVIRETTEAPVAGLAHRLDDTSPGQVVELNTQAQDVTTQIAERIAAQGGLALFVDYGGWRSIGDTFQAVADHRSVDPLAAPGQADLTAHVDFEAIADAAKPHCATSAMVTQGVLLERLGITPRAQALARNLSGDVLDTHIAAHRRLTHPDEMGDLFKALALYPQGAACPPGFAPI